MSIAKGVTSSEVKGFAGHCLAIIGARPNIKRAELIDQIHAEPRDRDYPRPLIKQHVYEATAALLRHGWAFRAHNGGFRLSEKGEADVMEHRARQAEEAA